MYLINFYSFRCEVCNYSTTTKGNLSIHMQSDKHLNNMQELQNGGPSAASATAASIVDKISQVSKPPGGPGPSPSGPVTLPPTMSPSKTPQSPSPKPTWRCDVCNYDTNVARNLRIHMTSEKHTHNMMALSQQNVKSMHQLSVIQQMMDPMKGLGGLLAGANPGNPPSTSEAALADLAFNQAVLAQMMGAASASAGAPGGAPPSGPPPDLNLAAIAAAAAGAGGLGGGLPLPGLPGLGGDAESPEALQEKQNQEDQNATTMFSCLVCRNFGCDSIDELSAHLNIDRSRTREHEVSPFYSLLD